MRTIGKNIHQINETSQEYQIKNNFVFNNSTLIHKGNEKL